MQLANEEKSDSESSDFMLKEYEIISSAFFDLSKQKTEMFRFYLILVTIPVTLIAAIIGLENQTLSFFALPDLVILVLLAVSVAGLLMTALIVDLRFEAIAYAKTVNLTRRFFVDNDKKYILGKYTLLPDGDDYPKFNEQPWSIKNREWKWKFGTGASFLEVLLMALLNVVYFGSAMVNLLAKIDYLSTNFDALVVVSVVVSVIFFLAHLIGYVYIANKRDSQWTPKITSTNQSESSQSPNSSKATTLSDSSSVP
jgi:hypothetical protein